MTDETYRDALKVTLDRLMLFNENEQRFRKRRFFIICGAVVIGFLAYMGVIYNLFNPTGARIQGDDEKGYVAVVRMSGAISAENGVSSLNMNPILTKAFKDDEAKGVVLIINSPGGSPVQSSNIYSKLITLSEKYDKKVICVGEDYLASAAYLIASAADKIYVNSSSITGSIGVIMQNFGFNELMEKVGVSNRVFTAGTNKNRFDPYKPLSEDDVAKADEILKNMHSHFIAQVMKKREGRIKKKPDEIFTGDFWTGDQALQLGLVDAIGDASTAIQEEFGVTAYIDYTRKSPFRDMLKAIKSSIDPFLSSSPRLQFQ